MANSVKKAAIYARVSTERQEKERTIESQLVELRDICQKDGVEIVKEYIDNGFSGATLARPALDQLRDDASKHVFDVVYLHSPDRLARKYVYQVLVLEELRQKGVEVKFLNKPVTDNPEDQLLLGIQGLMSEYERAKILERTRRGRLHKARNGEVMGGTAPYGYEYVRKSGGRGAYYKVNEDEAKVVRLIFSLYLKHRSTLKVLRELAERGIKPRCGAKFWSKGFIHRILTNECYVGRAYYNKYDKGQRRRRLRKRDEWIPIKIPAIISEQTFQLVQKTLKRHKQVKRIRTYLLSGLLKCVKCGSNYIGMSSARRYFFYRCGNFVKRQPLPRNCDARPVKAERLENAVLEAIKEAISKPQTILSHVLSLADNLMERAKDLEKQRRSLLNKRENVERKKRRLLDLYLEGAITKEVYREKLDEINKGMESLEKSLEEINKNLPMEIDKQTILKSIDYFSKLAKQRLNMLTPEELQEFLNYVIEEIKYDSSRSTARIIAHIPIMELQGTGNSFHSPPVLTGETWNKKLEFALEVKV